MSYAIDFGTTNTLITRWNSVTQQGDVVSLPPFSQVIGDQNPPLIPSELYVKDGSQGRVVVGNQVRAQGLDNRTEERFFRQFKRGIGAPIQGFLPTLEGTQVSFEQLGKWYLKALIDAVAVQTGEAIECLVLTTPVDSYEAYRHWLSQTCQGWGVENIRLLDESTAAALGYGVPDANQVLVLDFGGGTVDFSWVQLDAQQALKQGGFLMKWGDRLLKKQTNAASSCTKVIAKAGTNLGGGDIDFWIAEYFTQTLGIKPSPLVTRLAERLKIALAADPSATEVYFDDRSFDSFELSLDRSQLDTILQGQNFFARLDDLLEQVKQTAQRQGLTVDNLDAVLVVGGTSQLPMVQTWLNAQFPVDKIRCQQPFTAIALGALQLYQGRQIQDYLYHSYGIRYWNRRKNCHNWHPLIKSGQSYPMKEPVSLTLGASLDNQPSIELIVGELGSAVGATEVYFDGSQFITKVLSQDTFSVQPLNDRDGARQIAQLSPPGTPGTDRIRVDFWVDQQRMLRVTVEDILQNTYLMENQPVAQLQ